MTTLLLINTVQFEEALCCIHSATTSISVSTLALILKREYDTCTFTFGQKFSIDNPSPVLLTSLCLNSKWLGPLQKKYCTAISHFYPHM